MEGTKKHRGALGQLPIYVGKCARMFVYQNDWKFLPMSALIAFLVAFVAGQNMFVTMEGTFQGAFALSCVCIWNGFFNSIQSVCRERTIVKREFRSGMKISTYITAHMIYQLILCLLETIITIVVLKAGGVRFLEESVVTPWFELDLGITLFLTTYAADITSLFISCMVHSTTTAMTVMPFMLIFELVFSGGAFELVGISETLSNLSICKYGLNCVASVGNYNAQPSVTMWNTFFKLRSYEPVNELIHYIEDNNKLDEILLESGRMMQEAKYEHTQENVVWCWFLIFLFIVVFGILSVVALSFVDRDKR